MFEKNGTQPVNNWYLINKSDLDFLLEKQVRFVKVNSPKGSLILFDSRSIHSGYLTEKVRKDPKFRYVIYVSLTPAIRAKKADLEMKKQAVLRGATTSHWLKPDGAVAL
jgi:hypothetical protein